MIYSTRAATSSNIRIVTKADFHQPALNLHAHNPRNSEINIPMSPDQELNIQKVAYSMEDLNRKNILVH